MIFGPFEIAICLGAVLTLALAVALSLAGRDILDWYRSRGPRCPKCLAAINAEAYICWSCKAELESARTYPKGIPVSGQKSSVSKENY